MARSFTGTPFFAFRAARLSRRRGIIFHRTRRRGRRGFLCGVNPATSAICAVKFLIMDSHKTVEEFPYKTYLNILLGPLELIDIQKLVYDCNDRWWNQTLCKVNDAVVRLGIVEGEYHWHEHKERSEERPVWK